MTADALTDLAAIRECHAAVAAADGLPEPPPLEVWAAVEEAAGPALVEFSRAALRPR